MSGSRENIVILGAAESGIGAAILAKKKRFAVFVSDNGLIKDNYKADLDAHGIEWEEGGHDRDRVLSATTIVKSPGIPDTAPLVKEAVAKNINVISEIEWAYKFTEAKCIGITGTNGKTTTT